MNYDRIILELLDRVKNLEEMVDKLQLFSVEQSRDKRVEDSENVPLLSTQQVLEFIYAKKKEGVEQGLETLTMKAGEIEKTLGSSNRLVIVVNAMKQAMGEYDKIVSDVDGYSVSFEICYNLIKNVEIKNMKGELNSFEIKKGFAPSRYNHIKINAGEECLLVYDNRGRNVGIVWEHFENRPSAANGQAEIYFFPQYNNEFGSWHRMFVSGYQGGERIKYKEFERRIAEYGSYKYSGYIKP